jgi:hypothetical protein
VIKSVRSGGLSLSLFILCAWIESCRQMVGDNYALAIVSVIAHTRAAASLDYTCIVRNAAPWYAYIMTYSFIINDIQEPERQGLLQSRYDTNC